MNYYKRMKSAQQLFSQRKLPIVGESIKSNIEISIRKQQTGVIIFVHPFERDARGTETNRWCRRCLDLAVKNPEYCCFNINTSTTTNNERCHLPIARSDGEHIRI